MSIKILQKSNRIIVVVLSLLGFGTACELLTTEYGTPHADFIVNGSVSAEADQRPVKNIRIIMGQEITFNGRDTVINRDTVYSDINGKYIIGIQDMPDTKTFNLAVSDVDGTANGEFLPVDTDVNFVNPQFTGGDGHWYSGKTQKVLNISLKPKQK